MIPTPTEMTHFIELYQQKHFTQAAAKLRISQSALTQSIGKLEAKVGAPLIYRTKKGCVPTEAGELFYQHAQSLLDQWVNVSSSVKQQQKALSGKFRIGCHASLGVSVLPTFLKMLHQKAPGIEVSFNHGLSKELTEKVISHQLDLAFVVNPVRHNDLVLKKLTDDRMCLWKSKNHPTLSKRIFTDMTDHEVRNFLGKSFKRFADYSIVESSSLEIIRALVADGIGIGILPEKVALAEKSRLELFDSSLPTFHDEIYVAHRSETLKTEAGSVLRSVAKMVLG